MNEVGHRKVYIHVIMMRKAILLNDVFLEFAVVICDNYSHLQKRLDQATYCLDPRSEDYESKTYKPLVENPCCYTSHGCFIATFKN